MNLTLLPARGIQRRMQVLEPQYTIHDVTNMGSIKNMILPDAIHANITAWLA